MLHHQQRKKSKTNQPALAGIRVMSNMKDIMKVTNRGACISRYSCNVTLTPLELQNFFNACISRYSCNVTDVATNNIFLCFRLH